MAFPFDATLKDLVQKHPRDFLAAFDTVPPGPVTVLNVDLSTVTTAADIVFGLGDPLTEVVHIDFQASASADLHRDVLAYNALLHRRFGVPVHSIVLLLRPQARHRKLTGSVSYEVRPGQGKMDFRFAVIEVWQRPAEEWLTSNLGALPLAPLGRLPDNVTVEEGLRQVVRHLVERLCREAKVEEARRLVLSTLVLLGLRVTPSVAREILEGVGAMPIDIRESSVYQIWREEAEAVGRQAGLQAGIRDGIQRILLRQGRLRFGEPDEATITALRAIEDSERLERLSERLLEAQNWQDLLQTP